MNSEVCLKDKMRTKRVTFHQSHSLSSFGLEWHCEYSTVDTFSNVEMRFIPFLQSPNDEIDLAQRKL